MSNQPKSTQQQKQSNQLNKPQQYANQNNPNRPNQQMPNQARHDIKNQSAKKNSPTDKQQAQSKDSKKPLSSTGRHDK